MIEGKDKVFLLAIPPLKVKNDLRDISFSLVGERISFPHLTLGELSGGCHDSEKLIEEITGCLRSQSQFNLFLDDVSIFGGGDRSALVLTSSSGNDVEKIGKIVRQFGDNIGDTTLRLRKFVPHVTIVRSIKEDIERYKRLIEQQIYQTPICFPIEKIQLVNESQSVRSVLGYFTIGKK